MRKAGLILSLLFGLTTAAIAAAPQFKFPDLTGNLHALDDYIGQGKWTLEN